MDEHILLDSTPDDVDRTTPCHQRAEVTAYRAEIGESLHHPDVDGNVNYVQERDGKLGYIHELAPPAVEVTVPYNQPEAGQEVTDDCRPAGAVCHGVNLLEKRCLGTEVAGSNGEHAASGPHDQSIEGTEAGNDNKHGQQGAANVAEDHFNNAHRCGVAFSQNLIVWSVRRKYPDNRACR